MVKRKKWRKKSNFCDFDGCWPMVVWVGLWPSLNLEKNTIGGPLTSCGVDLGDPARLVGPFLLSNKRNSVIGTFMKLTVGVRSWLRGWDRERA